MDKQTDESEEDSTQSRTFHVELFPLNSVAHNYTLAAHLSISEFREKHDTFVQYCLSMRNDVTLKLWKHLETTFGLGIYRIRLWKTSSSLQLGFLIENRLCLLINIYDVCLSAHH